MQSPIDENSRGRAPPFEPTLAALHSLQFRNTNFSTHAICVLLVLKEQPVHFATWCPLPHSFWRVVPAADVV
ncbi:hypothetical protein C8R48DRAFT_711615 [Suillus tomentosus]|nr:hypothetical protein C8R48DRAFT_711615 [Suillus tomentosus]